MEFDIFGLLIGIIGIVIGAIVSYYFYRKSLRLKLPSWSICSNNIISGYEYIIDNVKVLYKGEIIPNLTVSKILFWNSGTDTINRDDIETINHLRIDCLNETTILDAKVLSSNNPSSQFNVIVSEDKLYVKIEFDYLDFNQGAVIQVIHTGTSSEDLKVIGDIKGVSKFNFKIIKGPRDFGLIPLFGPTIGATILSMGLNFLDLSELGLDYTNISLRVSIFTCFIGLVSIISIILEYRRKLKVHTPKGLETFIL